MTLIEESISAKARDAIERTWAFYGPHLDKSLTLLENMHSQDGLPFESYELAYLHAYVIFINGSKVEDNIRQCNTTYFSSKERFERFKEQYPEISAMIEEHI